VSSSVSVVIVELIIIFTSLRGYDRIQPAT
jgi:hypothetical protein